MLHERLPSLEKRVEPDRVHRLCYTDPDVFDLELRNIFERSWIYAGRFTCDDLRHPAGNCRHHLVRATDGFRIRRQRVEMVNSQAPYE